MTDDRSLERAARSWLETGPTQAPDRAVDAALLQIETTPQERDWHVPWRTPRMNSASRALAGVVAVVAVVLVGALVLQSRTDRGPATSPPPIASPVNASPSASASAPPTGSASASPAPSASSATGSRTFVSPSNGYSVTIPAGWGVVPASARWKDGATLSWGDTVVDDLHGANVRLSVGSKPLPAGQTASGMIQTMHDETLPCDQQLPAPATIPVGDTTGTLIINGCSALSKSGAMDPRGFIYTVGAVSGGRAYYFILDGAVDPAYLEALLATVKFDPASAVN